VTLLVEHWSDVEGNPAVGFVQLRVPADRAATLEAGRVTPSTVTTPVVAGALSVQVEPGLLYVRVVLGGCTYPEVLVTIPATTQVRLSDLLPITQVVSLYSPTYSPTY
jgi:hypothetical protein